MPTSNAIALIRLPFMNRVSSFLAAALMLVSIAALTHSKPVFGQETIIKSHGISTFGDLKYAADFKHLDYVNPDAPKGGEFSTWAFGTFDSMTPYILKGSAAAGSSFFYESLMSGTADEPDSMYGLLAESIEYPESRQWAIFNLRPEAKFSDGSQVTAEDVKLESYMVDGSFTATQFFAEIDGHPDDANVKLAMETNIKAAAKNEETLFMKGRRIKAIAFDVGIQFPFDRRRTRKNQHVQLMTL